jgi:hypothetical protein
MHVKMSAQVSGYKDMARMQDDRLAELQQQKSDLLSQMMANGQE